MVEHNNTTRVKLEALELLTHIAASLFVTDDPLSQAFEIVRQTAKIHEADISTLFLVEDHTRLILKAGVVFLHGREMALPKAHFYEINWQTQGECDMAGQGLTAFIAASGQSLNIESYEDLINHPCHTGKWDENIYPDGADDSRTGFGCMYAVPLRLPKGPPMDTVIGVFKIERRRNRSPFTEEDRKIFDLVAAHLSLILQTYFRVQYRVFSDVAHAIGGGLGRAYYLLTICETLLEHGKRDPLKVLTLITENLHGSIKIMDRACKRLNLVLEASSDPDRMTEKSIGELWEAVKDEVEIKSNVKIDNSRVIFNIHIPLTKDTKLRLRSIAYHDLITILGSLVDNAVQYAANQIPSVADRLIQLPAVVYITSKRSAEIKQLVFRVLDFGPGIPRHVIKTAQSTNYTELYRLPRISRTGQGTGLRRVFGLAKHNHWQISYHKQEGSIFELTIPNLSVETMKDEEAY